MSAEEERTILVRVLWAEGEIGSDGVAHTGSTIKAVAVYDGAVERRSASDRRASHVEKA